MTTITIILPLLVLFLSVGLWSDRRGAGARGVMILGIAVIAILNLFVASG